MNCTTFQLSRACTARCVLGIVFLATTGLSIHAAPLVSNLALPAAGAASVSGGQWLASSITTGSSVLGYQVESVTVDLFGGAGGGFFAAIYDDQSFAPGTQVANGLLSGSASPSTGLFNYTANNLTLAPNTGYWLVLGVNPGGSYSGTWNIELTGAQSSAFAWSIADILTFTVAPNVWAYGTGAGHFSVNGTPVPEADSATLLGICIAGFAALFAWRGRRCVCHFVAE